MCQWPPGSDLPPLGAELLQQVPDFVDVFIAWPAFHTAGEIDAVGLKVAEGLPHIVRFQPTGQQPRQGQGSMGQFRPIEGLPRSTRLLGVIGIQEQPLYTVSVEIGPFQIRRVANAQGLDAADPGQPFPQLPTILGDSWPCNWMAVRPTASTQAAMTRGS